MFRHIGLLLILLALPLGIAISWDSAKSIHSDFRDAVIVGMATSALCAGLGITLFHIQKIIYRITKWQPPSPPTEIDLSEGEKYILWIDSTRNDSGKIIDKDEKPLWSYTPTSTHSNSVVFTNYSTMTVITIKRRRAFSYTFEISENEHQIGSITYNNIFRTSCTIALNGINTWTFNQPLFTIYFWGRSRSDKSFWVRVGPSKRQWNILIQAGAESSFLLPPLAFIHRQYWRH